MRPPFLWLVPVRYPFGKEINPGLRPGAFSSRRRWWHDGPADPANPVVDGGGVRFHVVIICEIEGLAHRVDVAFREERENVGLKARQTGHWIEEPQGYCRRDLTVPALIRVFGWASCIPSHRAPYRWLLAKWIQAINR